MPILKIQTTYLLFIAILSLQCQAVKKSDGKAYPIYLTNYWTHSHEEDKENIKTYRSREFDFPESRGRESLELKSDGSYVEYKIGPTDRPLPVSGTFKFDKKDNTVSFYPTDSKYKPWKAEIITIQNSLLKIKRLD